jgi:hypothetical protein
VKIDAPQSHGYLASCRGPVTFSVQTRTQKAHKETRTMNRPQPVSGKISPIDGFEKDLDHAGDRLGSGLLHR